MRWVELKVVEFFTVWIDDGSVVFSDSGDDASTFIEIFSRERSDITETLNDNFLAGQTGCKSNLFHVFSVVDTFALIEKWYRKN